eukprot:9485249-Pyramimonas_sp.AAC.2
MQVDLEQSSALTDGACTLAHWSYYKRYTCACNHVGGSALTERVVKPQLTTERGYFGCRAEVLRAEIIARMAAAIL